YRVRPPRAEVRLGRGGEGGVRVRRRGRPGSEMDRLAEDAGVEGAGRSRDPGGTSDAAHPPGETVGRRGGRARRPDVEPADFQGRYQLPVAPAERDRAGPAPFVPGPRED